MNIQAQTRHVHLFMHKLVIILANTQFQMAIFFKVKAKFNKHPFRFLSKIYTNITRSP